MPLSNPDGPASSDVYTPPKKHQLEQNSWLLSKIVTVPIHFSGPDTSMASLGVLTDPVHCLPPRFASLRIDSPTLEWRAVINSYYWS